MPRTTMVIPIRANHLRPIFSSSPSEAAFFGATGAGDATALRCKGAVVGVCTRAERFAGGVCAAPPIPVPGSAAAGGTAGVGETAGGRGGGGGGAIVGAGGFSASCGGATGAAGFATTVGCAGTGSGGLAVGFQAPTGVPHLAQNCTPAASPLPHLAQNEGPAARAAAAGAAAGGGEAAVSERIRI